MIILRFAESLRDTILIDAILSVIERLPSSHISTITFLMKQLKKVNFIFNLILKKNELLDQ